MVLLDGVLYQTWKDASGNGRSSACMQMALPKQVVRFDCLKPYLSRQGLTSDQTVTPDIVDSTGEVEGEDVTLYIQYGRGDETSTDVQ
ncbi:hypothetical protein EMCRGX_G007239 [Ephydatia muelleri]